MLTTPAGEVASPAHSISPLCRIQRSTYLPAQHGVWLPIYGSVGRLLPIESWWQAPAVLAARTQIVREGAALSAELAVEHRRSQGRQFH